MNILESQVTDLTSIAESPLLSSSSGAHIHGGGRHNSTAESPADAATSGAGKRKADELNANANGAGTGNGVAHTRAKRNRYISIACNECKRRKIKCNGQTPCHRCGNLNLSCEYAPNCCSGGQHFRDSDEFRHMSLAIQTLQEQVEGLYNGLTALRNGGAGGGGEPLQQQQFGMAMGGSGAGSGSGRSMERALSISQQSNQTPGHGHSTSPTLTQRYRGHHNQHKKPRFQGPTSSAFGLDVAKNTLQNMGYRALEEEVEGEGEDTIGGTPIESPGGMARAGSLVGRVVGGEFDDPLRAVAGEEAIRLCRIYEEEIGLMYPVLNIEGLISHAKNLYAYLDAQRRGARSSFFGIEEEAGFFRDHNSNLLKMVLANALMVEGSGESDLGNRLFETVKGAVDDFLRAEVVDVGGLPLLTLVAIYNFHCDEEVLAWRMIGQVARMCTELGLHRRDALLKSMPDPEERASALRLFWSVYVLDRRWSFGTGLPFAIQDADLDPNLPEPEVSIPYLNVMIAYSKLGSRIWQSVTSHESASPSSTTSPALKSDSLNYLDYQISQWQNSIPPTLQLPTASSPQTTSRALHRLQILLYLRANQMRTIMYRPVLHSANSISDNLHYAQTAVELAKDTIRALTHLNQTTDIYRVQQVCFNYFLISALAVLFLASCHAPVQFSGVCREEFYMALDLVKGFSSKSYISKRLWKTIRGLKEVGPRLGLVSEEQQREHAASVGGRELDLESEDAHESAALAMAGLAGQYLGGGTAQGQTHAHGTPTQQSGQERLGGMVSPMNGFQMSHEMTSLFEAALGNSSAINGSAHGGSPNAGLGDGSLGQGEGALGVGVSASGSGASGGMAGALAFGGEEELYRQMRELF